MYVIDNVITSAIKIVCFGRDVNLTNSSVTRQNIFVVWLCYTVAYIVERGDRMVSRMSIGVPRGSVLLVYVNRTFYISMTHIKVSDRVISVIMSVILFIISPNEVFGDIMV